MPDPKDDSQDAPDASQPGGDDPISSLFKADAAVPAPEIDDQPSEAELSRWEATTRSSLFDDTVSDPDPAPPRLPPAAEPRMLASRAPSARSIGNAPTLIAAAAPPPLKASPVSPAKPPPAAAPAPAPPAPAGRPAPPAIRGGGLQLEPESLATDAVLDAPPPAAPQAPPRRRGKGMPARPPAQEPPPSAEAAEEEAPPKPRRRRRRNGTLVALGLGALAVVGAVVALLVGLPGSEQVSPATPPRAAAPPAPSPAKAAHPEAAPAGAQAGPASPKTPAPTAAVEQGVAQAPAPAPALPAVAAKPAPAETAAEAEPPPAPAEAEPASSGSTWLDGDARQLIGQARSLLDDDEGEKAVAVMRELLRREPRNHHAMEMLAKALIDQDQGAEAAKWAASAVSRRPKRARYRVLQGDALLMAGDQAGARAAWQKALELEPRDKGIKQRLGM